MVNTPNTVKQIKEYFHSMGIKTIPLGHHSKAPIAGFTFESLKDPDYDYTPYEDQNIGMAHGPVSGTYGADLDIHKPHTIDEALLILFSDPQRAINETLLVKTPKQGIHAVFYSPDGIYPKQQKYLNPNMPDVEIDIRSENGLTVLPPSTHPEAKYGKYSFISNTLTPAKLKWSDAQMILAQKGFFAHDTTTHMREYVDVSKLLMGNFPVGYRRRRQNSLYCKLRIRGKSEQEAKLIIQRTNQKCNPPLEQKELDYNCKYAEAFYQNHIKPNQKPSLKQKGFSTYDAAEKLMSEFRFVSHISGQIYYYTDGIYSKYGKEFIAKQCRIYWQGLEINTSMINEITNIIFDKTITLHSDTHDEIFDTDYTKIVLKNGVYDLSDGTITPYDDSIMATIKHPITYNKTKRCPKFLRFLSSCVNHDAKRLRQILDMMAMCFVKKNFIQKGFVIHGNGSNGKSTLLSILRDLLGINNTCSIPMQQFQKSQFLGYEMRGRSANISPDGGVEPITKTGFLKAVLGGDAIRCEQKYHNPFDYVPFCTMIFTFNDLPPVHDDSDGFARKIQTIHFDSKFEGTNCNYSIHDDIIESEDEKAGIFNLLMIVAAQLLRSKKIKHESTVQQTKQVWLLRSDSFFKFKTQYIVMGSDYRVSREKVEQKYNDFCIENGMNPIPSYRLFTKLKEISGEAPRPTKVDGKTVRMWRGFTLSSELVEVQQRTL